MTKILGAHVDPSALSPAEYLGQLKTWFYDNVPDDPAAWTFGDLKRNKDGGFNDEDLVQQIKKGTDTVAGAFGAKNIPVALRAIEIIGIERGREWGVATFNEFRKFFKLKPFTSFKEINSTEDGVAEALEALYGHPGNVELYPGLMVEQAKKEFSPGSGLCPGFTISEAILSDAVTLVRADRFYAHEYGPQSLTNFGFTAASSDFDVAGGGVMYKLLMRSFPGWYRHSSVYALYPFTTPEKTMGNFSSGAAPVQAIDYSAPAFTGPPIPVTSWQGVVQLLQDQTNFKVPQQLSGHDDMLSGDKPANTAKQKFMQDELYCPEENLSIVRAFYESLTARLIKKNARKLGGSYQIDIVQEGVAFSHAEFVGRFFGIPLRGEDSESTAVTDSYTPRALYNVLAHLFEHVFLDLDEAKRYKHLVVASKETWQLGDIVRGVVRGIKPGEGARSLMQLVEDTFFHKTATGAENAHGLQHFGLELIKRPMEQGQGKDVEEVVWTLIPTAATFCATQAQAWAQLIEIYLSDGYKSHWTEIEQLAQSEDSDSFDLLKRYALEGFRLFPATSGVIRVVESPTPVTIPSAPTPLPPKGTVLADFITAGRDPSIFPDPESIKLD
ncbi:peroxidase domain-containing protein [Hirsutella rhossiliensis]|uniref:Peroxidase domain-containing protein n=1 Tax=Hirsutella rhossiliensis TaxID=111463 RepID=A0A9P8SGF0_9HYPO|nr:peroxidase domain-containing protein [Hirsutella rhossiliensis]KAH0961968.1 peroxidase domain-containing protein [Hirsutella rhossiliensis]